MKRSVTYYRSLCYGAIAHLMELMERNEHGLWLFTKRGPSEYWSNPVKQPVRPFSVSDETVREHILLLCGYWDGRDASTAALGNEGRWTYLDWRRASLNLLKILTYDSRQVSRVVHEIAQSEEGKARLHLQLYSVCLANIPLEIFGEACSTGLLKRCSFFSVYAYYHGADLFDRMLERDRGLLIDVVERAGILDRSMHSLSLPKILIREMVQKEMLLDLEMLFDGNPAQMAFADLLVDALLHGLWRRIARQDELIPVLGFGL